jgi:hypothetical protein
MGAFMALAWSLGEIRENRRQVREHIMAKKYLGALSALAEQLCILLFPICKGFQIAFLLL